MFIESFCEEDTYQAGYQMGQKACRGEVYLLDGELGAGKTVFTKGFAKGMLVEEHITSPTFIILQQYESGRLPLYHFDVYRIGDADEMGDLGYEDYFYGDGVCLIEWAKRINSILPEDCTEIYIKKNPQKDYDYRRICINENIRD